jgi:hypothetical protein
MPKIKYILFQYISKQKYFEKQRLSQYQTDLLPNRLEWDLL